MLFALINMLPRVCLWNRKGYRPMYAFFLAQFLIFYNKECCVFLFPLTDDPNVPQSHQHHRNYLKAHVVLKEVKQCSRMFMIPCGSGPDSID